MSDDIIVLASGPSVKKYNLRDLDQCGQLIALNGAALYVKPHTAFTMDRLVSELCYPIWRNQGVPEIWLRKGIAKNFVPDPTTVQFEHDHGSPTVLSRTHGYLNGSNSGTCALNLAVQRQPKRIFLLGFDMCRLGPKEEPYWHPPYIWNTAGGSKDGNLMLWAAEIDDMAEYIASLGIDVYNVNHRSRITAFPVVSYDQFRDMTK